MKAPKGIIHQSLLMRALASCRVHELLGPVSFVHFSDNVLKRPQATRDAGCHHAHVKIHTAAVP
jgi:hypothetical protein